MAELLLAKDYEVHGIGRREASEDPSHRLRNIRHLTDKLKLHVGAIENHASLYKIVGEVNPDECYHLAGSSFVSYALDDDLSVLSSNYNSTHHLLASIKELVPACRFYFAGSSEMFGRAEAAPQDEKTRFSPRSIYGIAKVASYYLVTNYRRDHGLFACSGILYNHESPRRGYEFVTRKITSGVAKIFLGMERSLEIGNMDARRDWGYAPEYVEAMWKILNAPAPDDYVIATGELHTVREFLSLACSIVDLNYENFVRVNPAYYRPDEGTPLVGNCSKATSVLGWQPRKNLRSIVEEMVLADIELLRSKN